MKKNILAPALVLGLVFVLASCTGSSVDTHKMDDGATMQ